MAKKFSVGDLLNDASKAAVANIQYEIEFIKIDELIPSVENFYRTDDIEGLATLIEYGGLQQNLVVWNDQGTYRILSGHRRHKALTLLRDRGNEIFERVPCLIIEAETLEDAEMQLLIGNIENRQHNDFEKMQQAIRFGELIELKKQKGISAPGKKRDLIAQMLNLSSTHVQRYLSIDKNLKPELKEKFKSGDINITTAAELARLSKEKQIEKLEQIEQGENVSASTISKEISGSSNDSEAEEQINDNADASTDYVNGKEIVQDEKPKIDSEVSKTEVQEIKKVPIMDTSVERIFIADKSKIDVIESYVRKYTGKLKVVSTNISKYQQLNREPNKNDLDEQLEYQIIVEALMLLREQVSEE